jgi:hypothetical protein
LFVARTTIWLKGPIQNVPKDEYTTDYNSKIYNFDLIIFHANYPNNTITSNVAAHDPNSRHNSTLRFATLPFIFTIGY